ncbi:uncharacterized protein A1O9_08402 [Exophiala aquamarina CBS 119918]|uniref:Large ribosomal subunit protein uL23m n=1 Tax=Exophiala aquamarina CBS 119918 TaxID=1182545 RepID=A0A072P7F0_9EURO|nr:uncharacterized protein A1O9_08402 [Exophiala aquamarina CBS 119918]KEF55652.1 hypothetical protein A1O9_08402 [Exophiala aquamarina CBS 119918]
MPRASCVPAKLVTYKPTKLARNTPRLWNAKERIRTNVGLSPQDFYYLKYSGSPHPRILAQLNKSREEGDHSRYEQIYSRWLKLRYAEPAHGNWWNNEKALVSQYMENHPVLHRVSKDVRDFISSNPSLQPWQVDNLLRNPTRYFSVPKNVPLEDRQQVYFPAINDTVVLLRTTHLGPRYAVFQVPLHFNKLEMRDYLKSAYNVDVLHVRSTITQAKLTMKKTLSKNGQGYYVRAKSKKKMTCLLAKPFVYPEEIKDLSAFDNKEYWDSMFDQEQAYNDETTTKPNKTRSTTYKSQARAIVQEVKSSKEWKPTWVELRANRRAMGGAVTATSFLPQPALPTPSSNSPENGTKSKAEPAQQETLSQR